MITRYLVPGFFAFLMTLVFTMAQASADVPKRNSIFPGLSTWGNMPINTNYDGVVAHLDKIKHPYEAKVFHKTGAKYLTLKSTSPMGPARLSDGSDTPSTEWKVTIYFRRTDDLLRSILVEGPELGSHAAADELRDRYVGLFGVASEARTNLAKSVTSTSSWVKIWRNQQIELKAETQYVFRDARQRWSLWFRWGPVKLPKEKLGPGPVVPGEKINAPVEIPARKSD